MQFIPLFKVSDMRRTIAHYTEVLNFRLTWPEETPDSPVVVAIITVRSIAPIPCVTKYRRTALTAVSAFGWLYFK